MSTHRILIEGGTVVNASGSQQADVLVEGETIAAIGAGLAVFNLILDFDLVERGVAAGAPQSEAWRAAFALTVTLVWLYWNLLRILAILRGGE